MHSICVYNLSTSHLKYMSFQKPVFRLHGRTEQICSTAEDRGYHGVIVVLNINKSAIKMQRTNPSFVLQGQLFLQMLSLWMIFVITCTTQANQGPRMEGTLIFTQKPQSLP